MNDTTIQSQITRLEIGLAHQQRLCEQLNDVVTLHTRSMMQLERAVGELKKQLADLQVARKDDVREALNQEKPPHY